MTTAVTTRATSQIPILTEESLAGGKELSAAAKAGIFYFPVPEDCQWLIPKAVKFCYEFPKDEELKKYSDGNWGGYHNRPEHQIESFYVEKKDSRQVMPEPIRLLAEKMQNLSDKILKRILINIALPQQHWRDGTGSITEGRGQYHASYNHYRSEKQTDGISQHVDFGFVTIIFAEKAGLEARLKGAWQEVPPLEGHFVVILGKAFEVLANDVEKVSAAWHRVGQQTEDRVSFAVSSDNNALMGVKRYIWNGDFLQAVYQDYHAYLRECFKAVYGPKA
jgi:hypothetical protein